MKIVRLLLIICILLTLGTCDLAKNVFNMMEEEKLLPTKMETQAKQLFYPVELIDGHDIILSSYRDPALQHDVLKFFENITGSEETSELILYYASMLNIAPALAFALCEEESGYNPIAMNRNQNGTIDRGLFQLNSATFPNLKTLDFHDPGLNTWHGLSHLRWCLDNAGTEVSGLAMYNAGVNRVRSAETPKRTLDYVSRILKKERKIEELFIVEYARIIQAKDEEKMLIAKNAKTPFRFSLLTPLGVR